MSPLSDQDIHEIVSRVVRQTLGSQDASPVTPPAATTSPSSVEPTKSPAAPNKVVAIGTDHGGVELKKMLISELAKLGYQVVDCGTNSSDPVDYPDIARAVALLVAQGKAWRGVIIDGAGIGSCMAANKVPGVRAALVHDAETARGARIWNHANVLALSLRLTPVGVAKEILDAWFTTSTAEGEAQSEWNLTQIARLAAIENRYRGG